MEGGSSLSQHLMVFLVCSKRRRPPRPWRRVTTIAVTSSGWYPTQPRRQQTGILTGRQDGQILCVSGLLQGAKRRDNSRCARLSSVNPCTHTLARMHTDRHRQTHSRHKRQSKPMHQHAQIHLSLHLWILLFMLLVSMSPNSCCGTCATAHLRSAPHRHPNSA